MIRILALLLVAISTLAQAQDAEEKRGYKYYNNFDLALSTVGKQSAVALYWAKFHPLTKKKRFKVGYGVRFTSQFGKDLYYTTAPASLTNGKTGPGVLFAKDIPANIDTLYVPSSQHNAFNISIHLQYTIKEKLDIGFNIDAIGVGFGANTSGKYIGYQSSQNESMQSASPTRLNVLLVDANDRGMLNSELYLRYWFQQKWAVKIGIAHLFTEYTTDQKLRLDNDRWRDIATLGMVGITYSPFR